MVHQYGAPTGLQLKISKLSRLTILNQKQPEIDNLKKLRDVLNVDSEETSSEDTDLIIHYHRTLTNVRMKLLFI